MSPSPPSPLPTHLTFDQHVAERRSELGRQVMQKKRVYLDLCVWIALRNAELGTNPHGDASALLQKLREAIGAGRVLCPISEIVFLELMKQADVRTRRATTRLIDELSTGVALTPRIDRVTIELRQLLLKRHEPTVSPSALVWSKVTQVLGPFVPDSPHFGLALKKWTVSKLVQAARC